MSSPDDLYAQREFNDRVVTQFRENGGVVGGALEGMRVVLLHHVGARSGLEHIVPLAYHPQKNGRLVIIATNGGSGRHPGWCHNLRSNPRTTIEVGDEVVAVVAEELTGAARQTCWEAVVTASPVAGDLQRAAGRLVPVFVLTRQDERSHRDSEEPCDTP